MDQIDKIVDDEIITTKDGRTHKYLVRWKEKPPTNDSWIDHSELQKIDPDIWSSIRVLLPQTQQNRVLLQPGENDADIMKSSKPPTKPNSKA